MAPINDPLPYIKTTANGVGKRGTTSLSEALKSNKTLTKLDLSSEDRRQHTNDIHQQPILYLMRKQ